MCWEKCCQDMIVILYKMENIVLGEMLTGYDYYPLLGREYGAERSSVRVWLLFSLTWRIIMVLGEMLTGYALLSSIRLRMWCL